MNYRIYSYIVMVAAVLSLWLVPNSLPTALAASVTVSITTPAEQATVSSLTNIVGTVDFPEFLKYEIFLQGNGNTIWAAVGYSPVVNGNLARLDPRVFADGTYRLIIRQVRKDSNYTDYAGPSFKIDNPLNAPQPYYPEIEPNFLYPTQGKALARLRNCTGADLNFDYGSPTPFLSSGQINLPGKRDGAICPFSDLMLLPGEYRGTVRQGNNASGYSINAESGKVYQLLYNGLKITIEPLKGDDKAKGADVAQTSQVQATATAKPAPAVMAPVVEKKTLPESGQEMVSNTPFIIIALAFILFVIVAGMVSVYRGRYGMM